MSESARRIASEGARSVTSGLHSSERCSWVDYERTVVEGHNDQELLPVTHSCG